MAEWFVRCTTKLAPGFKPGLSAGYSVMCGTCNLRGYSRVGLDWYV